MGVDIVFLGTASCFPTPHRSVSCTAVRFEDGSVWLFDCGEGSQVQLQKSSVKPVRVTKIFITHLHGDHMFGLPGLVCTLGTAWQGKPGALLQLFGPLGLRKFLRHSLSLSRSLLPFQYMVHELVPVTEQFPADWTSWEVEHKATGPLHPQERLGQDICVAEEDGRYTWHLFKDEAVNVRAGMIHHTIPSYGFVVQLASQPGQLDAKRLQELGLPPGPLYGMLKRGQDVSLPSGLVIRPSDVVGPAKRGLKLTVLGDTRDPSPMEHLVRDSDVLLHEATMEGREQEKALEYGHSTPAMAACFAARVGARRLVLYHFSQRFKLAGQPDVGREETVAVLLDEARAALPLGSDCEVSLAEDLLVMAIR